MKVSEIFEGIQGEGDYAGFPALFIRLSGCNHKCPWCDTKYHEEGAMEISVEDVVKKIRESKLPLVVWTGGEPMLQIFEIRKVALETINLEHHVETNGTILEFENRHDPKDKGDIMDFQYVCFSPKERDTLNRIIKFLTKHWHHGKDEPSEWHSWYDIKVVTDGLDLNADLIDGATMLMPLTTENEAENKIIQRRVWRMCQKKGLRYCPRLHVDVWGKERGK